MIAGPKGAGKTTLAQQLTRSYLIEGEGGLAVINNTSNWAEPIGCEMNHLPTVMTAFKDRSRRMVVDEVQYAEDAAALMLAWEAPALYGVATIECDPGVDPLAYYDAFAQGASFPFPFPNAMGVIDLLITLRKIRGGGFSAEISHLSHIRSREVE